MARFVFPISASGGMGTDSGPACMQPRAQCVILQAQSAMPPGCRVTPTAPCSRAPNMCTTFVTVSKR
eukprot:3518611-Prymnesium_polylepis.1